MTRPSNGARTVAISRCSLVRAISASTAARWATSASTPLTALAADCACNNTALRSASAARCAVLARSTSSAETKPSFSNGSVRRNVSVACFAAARAFSTVALTESAPNCCASTLRWVSIICLSSAAREASAFARLASYGRGSMRNSKSPCFTAWLSVTASSTMRPLTSGTTSMVSADA